MDVVNQILPVFLIFLVGIILKQTKILSAQDAKSLFKLMVYVSAPALVFNTIRKVELNKDYGYIALAAFLLLMGMFLVSFLVTTVLGWDKKTKGVGIVGSMNIDTGLGTAFLISALGDQIVARSEMFNRVHSVILFSLVYAIAAYYGSRNGGKLNVLKKIVLMPPLWATFLGLIFNYFDISIGTGLDNTFLFLGRMIPAISLLGLGLSFSVRLSHVKIGSIIIIMRMIGGFVLALLLASLFGLDETSRLVLLVMASGPVGSNTVVFSSLEGLDEKLAASISSISLLIALGFLSVILAAF